jgi:hypothetical protein
MGVRVDNRPFLRDEKPIQPLKKRFPLSVPASDNYDLPKLIISMRPKLFFVKMGPQN